MWILIYIIGIWGYSSPIATGNVEFSSLDRCEKAGKAMKDSFPKTVTWVCMQK